MPEIQEIVDTDHKHEMKVSYYAVRSGFKCGIYTDVESLVEATRGHPHVEFERFDTLDAADAYLCSYLNVVKRAQPTIPVEQVYYEVETFAIPKADAQSGEQVQYSGFCFCWGDPKRPMRLEAIGDPCPREVAELIGFEKLLDLSKDMPSLHVITRSDFLLRGLEETSKIHKTGDEASNSDNEEKAWELCEMFKPYKAAFIRILDAMKDRKIVFQSAHAQIGFYAVRLALVGARNAAALIVNQKKAAAGEQRPSVASPRANSK